MNTVKWGKGGPFSIVPEWLLYAEIKRGDQMVLISDRAVRLFAVLGRLADKELRGFHGRKTLAENLGCSTSTLDVAIAELREVGAVTLVERRREDGSRTSNEYTLNIVPTTEETPPEPPVGGSTEGSVSKNREPLGTERVELRSTENGSNPDAVKPPKLAKIEGRNLAVDALAAVCDVDMRNRAQATRLTKALKDITVYAYEDLTYSAQELAHGERERFTAYVAEEIGRRARLYDQRMRDAELTPTALAAWWHQLVKRPRGTGMTAADVLAMHDE